jgi:replicative DNA helicase
MSVEVTEQRGPAAPPHDLGAEMGVLGAVMRDAGSLADVSRIVTAEDFYRPAHSTIFATLLRMSAAGDPIDEVSLMSALHASGDLVRVGAAPYVLELMRYAIGDPRHHAATVADMAEGRRWIEHATMIGQEMASPGRTTREKRERIFADHERVIRGRVSSRGRWAGEIIGDAIDYMAAAAEGDTTARTVPTGFADLDRMLGGGLHAGQLIIVAGRPGLGKSTLGADFVRNAALRTGLTSMFVSLEMSDVQLMLRFISAETRLPLAVIRSGILTDLEWERVTALIDRFVRNTIAVYSDPDMYLPQIRAEARRLRTHHDLRLLVVDYLQLMASPGRTESRQQEVSDLSRGLKKLSKEVEIPVVAAAQLNRNPDTRSDKRPQLSDLRESGSIEQDADVVILIDRPDAHDPQSPRAGEVDFIVAKHRDGPTGTVTVANQLHLARFADMAIV